MNEDERKIAYAKEILKCKEKVANNNRLNSRIASEKEIKTKYQDDLNKLVACKQFILCNLDDYHNFKNCDKLIYPGDNEAFQGDQANKYEENEVHELKSTYHAYLNLILLEDGNGVVATLNQAIRVLNDKISFCDENISNLTSQIQWVTWPVLPNL